MSAPATPTRILVALADLDGTVLDRFELDVQDAYQAAGKHQKDLITGRDIRTQPQLADDVREYLSRRYWMTVD